MRSDGVFALPLEDREPANVFSPRSFLSHFLIYSLLSVVLKLICTLNQNPYIQIILFETGAVLSVLMACLVLAFEHPIISFFLLI